MSTANQRRQYTEEFKAGAVRLMQQAGKPVAQVARELGINPNLLYRWQREERQASARGTSRAAHKAEAEELTRLRRELDMMRKERDFLKSAAAYFARERK
jgi:transposase